MAHNCVLWKAVSGNSEVFTRALKSSRPDRPFSPSDGGSGSLAEYLPVRSLLVAVQSRCSRLEMPIRRAAPFGDTPSKAIVLRARKNPRRQDRAGLAVFAPL